MRDLAAPAECAAVVKADAYGLGMAQAAPALARAGCKTFFVATLGEARALRALLPDATIYVFAGLMPGTAEIYRAHDLRPVLNSADEISEWAVLLRKQRREARLRRAYRQRHEPAWPVGRRGRARRRRRASSGKP